MTRIILRALAVGAGLGMVTAQILNDTSSDGHLGYFLAALAFSVVALIPPRKPKHRADKDT